tara:strand:+ start:75 stop:272 length:198 start_codon:yes stop_codon:yes gene_type:complete
MKKIYLISLLFLLVNCSAHSVRVGTKCTLASSDGSFEKSFLWIIDKESLKTFDKKINKENCKKNT